MVSARPPQRPSSGLRRRRALLGLLPVLALVVFGFRAILRESDLAYAEVRSQAQTQARSIADRIARDVFNPALPTVADITAWNARPTSPESDPLLRLSQSAPGTLAQLIHTQGRFPSPPEVLKPFSQPSPQSPLHRLWSEAEATESQSPRSVDAAEAWQRVEAEAAGSLLQPVARFRFAAALSRCGRTSDAVPLLESLVAAPADASGETGLPIDILASRALLQIASFDPAAASTAPAWASFYCHRVLIRWQWPEALLTVDGFPDVADKVPLWKSVAELHQRTLQAMSPISAPLEDSARLPKWITTQDGSKALLTRRVIRDGYWLVLWPKNSLQNALLAFLPSLGLPPHLGVAIEIAGTPVSPPPRSADRLASATSDVLPGLNVSLMLVDPETLVARHLRRQWILGTLLTLACVAAVASYVATVRASERQRQLAAQQADFVAAVSHELRAPLAAIRLLSEELIDLGDTHPQRQQTYHQLILREARRLGLLVDNVLRHSRLERRGPDLELVLTDVTDLARSTALTFQPHAAERNVRLQLNLPDAPVSAVLDPQAITQILVNLIDNALKHAPEGSPVEIAVHSPSVDVPHRKLQLSVTDQGPGIPEHDHARIFDAFVRRGTELRRETPGVGLGLAIVRRLVLAHHGNVVIRSSPGAGSTFIVELPAQPPA